MISPLSHVPQNQKHARTYIHMDTHSHHHTHKETICNVIYLNMYKPKFNAQHLIIHLKQIQFNLLGTNMGYAKCFNNRSQNENKYIKL